jgi:hypothetical protein
MILPDVDTPNTLGGDPAHARNPTGSEFRAQACLGSV